MLTLGKTKTFSRSAMRMVEKVAKLRRGRRGLAKPGSFGVWHEDDGESYWLPEPCFGHMTVKMSPDTFPTKDYMAAVQIIDEGGTLPDHGHGAQDEFLFVWQGEGKVFIDGVPHPVKPGSLVYVGRHRKHGFVNTGNGPMKIFFLCAPSAGVEHMMRAVGKPRKRPGERRPKPWDHPDESSFEPILDKYVYSLPEQMVAEGTDEKYPGR